MPAAQTAQSAQSAIGGAGQALSAAQALMILSDPKASEAQKALAWSRLGVTGLQVSGGMNAIGKAIPSVAPAIPYVGPALSAAGLGYGLSQLAGSDARTGRKAVEGVKMAAGTLFPVLALQQLAYGLASKGARSGSPQVAGFSRGSQDLLQPALHSAFESVISGEKSLPKAIGAIGGPGPAVWSVVDPVSKAFADALGIQVFNPGPTSEGGRLRQGLGKMFDSFKLPININFQDRSAYNLTPEQLAGIAPEHLDIATKFGNDIAQLTQQPKYAQQFRDILINNYHGDVGKYYDQFQQELVRRAQEQAARDREKQPQAQPAAQAAQAQGANAPGVFNLFSLLQSMIRPNLGEV